MQEKMETEISELQTHLKYYHFLLLKIKYVFSETHQADWLYKQACPIFYYRQLSDPEFHYRLFQKVDQWMNKDEQLDNDAKKRLEDANQVR